MSFFYLYFSSRKIVYILTNTNNLVYSILFMFFILFHMINNFVNLLFFNKCNNIDYIIVLSVYFLNLFIYLFSYNFVQYLFDIFNIFIPIHSYLVFSKHIKCFFFYIFMNKWTILISRLFNSIYQHHWWIIVCFVCFNETNIYLYTMHLKGKNTD